MSLDYTDEDIKRYFDLGNRDFLNQRIERINEVFDEYGIDNFYVAYSGGKDSNVLSKLIDLAVPGNHIPRLFMHTGIELNAVVDFVHKKAEKDFRVHIIEPQTNIRDYLEENGYPFKSKEHAKKVFVYWNTGPDAKTVQKYLYGDGNPNHTRYLCPKKLRYQFTEENKLKISAWCCYGMKEQPQKRWAKKMGYSIVITGMRQAEGGARNRLPCLSKRAKEKMPRTFNPLAIANDDFMDWMIDEYDIDLPIVYYPPYNFKRTGCKGCPFALELQEELDVLEKYFPNERKQCEQIWKPVYDEYRRIGYRLKDGGTNADS